ncbi:MAG: NADP-dependent oxidoreductase [Pseudomonadota bacterium]
MRLKKAPSTSAGPKWQVTHNDLPPLKDGQMRVKLHYISIDPGMAGWITAKRSYIEAIGEGDVMRAFGVGEVVESRAEQFPAGSFVTGFTGVQTEAVLDTPGFLRSIDPELAPLGNFMSGLGMPGFTGYFGMSDIGAPQAGETVIVSAAAGAVGSIASQIAKLAGARVIGIAGGMEKCALLTDRFGLDGAIDYKAGPIKDALREHCPDGIDVYFDNVGGDTLDAVLMRMNRLGRIVLCGGISQYGGKARGPANYLQIVTHSLTMRGFTMRDYLHRIPEAEEKLAALIRDNRITFLEHVLEGIESFPEGFKMIFAGGNVGKLMIKV